MMDDLFLAIWFAGSLIFVGLVAVAEKSSTVMGC